MGSDAAQRNSQQRDSLLERERLVIELKKSACVQEFNGSDSGVAIAANALTEVSVDASSLT